MKNMDKQSDLVNPKSVEVCGTLAHTDDEFEEHSEGEMLSEDEPNEDGSSDEESAEEIPCGEEYDDADSCAEGSNEDDSEELEEVLEEDNEEDEEISEVLEEKPNRKEALSCSMDQISPVNDNNAVPSLFEEKKTSDVVVDVPQVSGKRRRSGWDVKDGDVVVNDSVCLSKKSETRLCTADVVNNSGEESYQEDSDEELEEAFEEYSEDDDSVKETNEEDISKEPTTSCSMGQLLVNKPSTLLEEEKASATVVDVPRVSSKRRPSRWDIKAEDLVPVKDSGNLGKREIGWSSDIKMKSSELMNDSADLNKRKTRWSSDKSPLDIPRPVQPRNNRKVEKRLEWLNMKLQTVNSNLEHYLTAKENQEKQTLSSQTVDDVHFAKLLEDKEHFLCQIYRMHEAKRKTELHRISYKFKKLLALPMKEDSRYNLAALIIGPNGKTLNDMEEKTGTKLSLRGKDGSYRRNISKCQDVHLMIKANSYESIDAAVSMIQDLWQHKKHIKAAQLKELAKIKGTVREEKKNFVWTRCDICGDLYHPASECPLIATDAETVKKFHTGPGSLFSSYGDKDKCETQIMPAGLVVNCMPPNSNDNKLVVGAAAPSAPSPNANLPSYPGLSVVPPSSWNANIPNFPGFTVPPSTSNANAPSYEEFSTAPSLPFSMSLNLPSYSKNAPLLSSSSIAKPPNYTKYVAIPPSSMSCGLVTLPSSSSNTNLSTRHVPPGNPPASSNANLQSYPAVIAVPPSSNTNLPFFSGFVAIPPSSNANRPSFPGVASICPPSNINWSSYSKFSANPPASSNANVPSYPRFTAATPSNSNLSGYTGLAAIPPPSSNAKSQSFPDCTAVLPSPSNENMPSYVGLAAIHPPSSHAKPPSYPKSTAITPSNGNLSSYTRLAPAPSKANLSIRTGLAPIPQEISKSNNWPGPPGSSLPESSSSFLKGGYNSPVQIGSAPLQTSIPYGTNAHILDRKKPVPTGARPSTGPNFSQYPEFTATSRGIDVPNCWPHPTGPTVPESSASFPKNSCNSLKCSETMLLQTPTPPGSTGQPSTSSSQFTGIAAMSKELASFPGYTGLAANCPPTSKANLPSYPGLAAIPKASSNPNLSSHAGLASIPQKAPLSNNWPSPPLPVVPKSGSSVFKSNYNSPAQSGSVPFQSLTSFGKNTDVLDGKKLGVTATPPNSRNYSNFAPPEVPERNFWPRPSVSILPESGTSLSVSIYSSLNYRENRPLPSSAPLGSTGQTTVSSSHLPYAVSNELASFPDHQKRFVASYPFDRPMPSSSLSSQPAHFTSNFSGNQMDPAWRNYNHPTSN